WQSQASSFLHWWNKSHSSRTSWVNGIYPGLAHRLHRLPNLRLTPSLPPPLPLRLLDPLCFYKCQIPNLFPCKLHTQSDATGPCSPPLPHHRHQDFVLP
ncbi:unnamed protein product, partial [Prunus brigantina]